MILRGYTMSETSRPKPYSKHGGHVFLADGIVGTRRRHLWQDCYAMAFPRQSLSENRGDRATHLDAGNSWQHEAPWRNLPLAHEDRHFTIRAQRHSFRPAETQTTEKEKGLKEVNKQKDIKKDHTECNKLMYVFHRLTQLFEDKKRTRVCLT